MLEPLLPAHFNPKLCVLFQETPGSVALPEFLHFINTATHTRARLPAVQVYDPRQSLPPSPGHLTSPHRCHFRWVRAVSGVLSSRTTYQRMFLLSISCFGYSSTFVASSIMEPVARARPLLIRYYFSREYPWFCLRDHIWWGGSSNEPQPMGREHVGTGSWPVLSSWNVFAGQCHVGITIFCMSLLILYFSQYCPQGSAAISPRLGWF